MFLRRLAGLTIAGVLTFSVWNGIASANELAAPKTEKEAKLVKFEGKLIDLSKGWGEAQACVVWETADASECFRSEAQLEAHTAKINDEINTGTRQVNGEAGTMAACSSYLRIYEHTSWGGRVLQFADRGVWQNLSGWGFSDETSSYRVGACSANLAEHFNGSGLWYPGATSAGSSSSCMCAGSTNWNDRVSSIRVN
ncbi:MAG TPA: hypothetical protein VGD58_15030 [Herpetosiphonaceae bacterium]